MCNALCLVELRGFEPLTLACHAIPRQITKPSAAVLGTASALLTELARRSTVMRQEAACGIAANKLLTGRALGHPLCGMTKVSGVRRGAGR